MRWSRAHPRSRGENLDGFGLVKVDAGSSPLTRGKPGGSRGPTVGSGLIPAHAGKTRWARCERSGCAAHPRSRGENPWWPSGSLSAVGSSPLTRGKPNSSRQRLVAAGLIPAHAGKTIKPMRPLSAREAHPRSRGENVHAPTSAPSGYGSSPLTRGKPCRRRRYDT